MTAGLSAIVRPGDAAPSGRTFDWAAYPYSNDAGDVVFLGHMVEQGACPPPDPDLLCLDAGVSLFQAATDSITTIVSPGAYPAVAFARLNARRDMAFVVATAPGPVRRVVKQDGIIRSVALPGDAAPRGGHIFRLAPDSSAATPIHLANTGAMTYVAVLDTDVDGDGRRASGAFRWEDGTLTLIARTGSVLQGFGAIRDVRRNDVAANERGDTVFAALADGREAVVGAMVDP
jgi:hypothetical protein